MASITPRALFLRGLLSVVLISLLFGGLFAKRGLLDWIRMTRRNAELHNKLEASRVRLASVSDQIKRLRSDRATQEWVVREQLGFVRPGEVVLEYP